MGDRLDRSVHRGSLLRGVHLQRVIRLSMSDDEGERERDDGGIPIGADLTEPSRLSLSPLPPSPLFSFPPGIVS